MIMDMNRRFVTWTATTLYHCCIILRLYHGTQLRHRWGRIWFVTRWRQRWHLIAQVLSELFFLQARRCRQVWRVATFLFLCLNFHRGWSILIHLLVREMVVIELIVVVETWEGLHISTSLWLLHCSLWETEGSSQVACSNFRLQRGVCGCHFFANWRRFLG